MPLHTALIALGANLGDSSKSLLLAIEMLSNDPEIRSIRASSIHQTAPVTAEEGQSTYANAAAALETRLSPHELIQKLRKVESEFGRIRDKVWSSRTLDLDIVGFDSLVMFDEELAIPHPRMTVRRFVIDPLAEVAPGWIHPQLSWTVSRIQSHLSESPRVVSLGEFWPKLELREDLRQKLINFVKQNPAWSFQAAASGSLFEVRPLHELEKNEKWLLPRFFPTEERLEVVLEQCLATCRGLTISQSSV